MKDDQTDDLTGPFEVTFEGPLSDELVGLLTGSPPPRRAVEGEPREEAFIPGRRIAHGWVQVDFANGYAVVREDVFRGMLRVEGVSDG